MSHTSSNIIREFSLQNHQLWLRINYKISRFLSMFNLNFFKTKNSNAVIRTIKEGEAPNRFISAIKRIEFKYGYEPSFSEETPYGYYKTRHIIGEQTKVSGGIFLSANAVEALVVDEKYGVLDEVYLKLMSRISLLDTENASYEYQVFSRVVALTRETLRYSEESVENIAKHYRIQADEKVSLDLYIKKKVGVARHQVLLAAFLLEKLKSKFLIKGTHSIDPTIADDVKNERLIFRSCDGESFRFDPTKGLGKTAIH